MTHDAWPLAPGSSMPKRVVMDPLTPDAEALRTAADVLARGLLVAFPTDTLYGLAVDPRNPEAVRALFRAKQRGEGAIPLIASDVGQVERDVGRMSPMARRLAARFWPGPLTLILEALPSLAEDLHGGARTVGVRVPNHPVARQLAREAGHPLTATSANLSGTEAASTADEVIAGLGDAVALVLDAGPTPGGHPSTIVDTQGDRPVLVRAGAVAWARVLESLE